MKTSQIKVLAILLFLFLYACADDDDNTTTTTTTLADDDPIALTDQTAQLITEWSDLWVSIDQFTNNMRPNTITRSLAYIHLTGYETAVPFMDGYTSNNERLDELDVDINELEDNVNLDLALNRAYAIAFDHFMFSISPEARGDVFRFRNNKEEELEQGLSEDVIDNSRRWGRHVARRVIAYSETDEAGEEQVRDQTPADYVAPVGDGLWAASDDEDAWFPYWREVRAFVIEPEETSSTDFSSLLTYSEDATSDYYMSMSSVNTIATAAANGDDENLWIAEFWADDVEGIMISPPGRQFSIANQLIEQYDLDFDQTLELLLRLSFAINDAAVSAWDDKYTYNTQRPSTYINEFIDEDFTTNLARFVVAPNPAFPSYPSGHATFAGAAGGVFIDFFGTDAIDFTDNTYLGFDYIIDFIGTPRSYTSFSEMASENAFSRVPLGVHIQEDSTEGLRLGYEIADAVNALDLSN